MTLRELRFLAEGGFNHLRSSATVWSSLLSNFHSDRPRLVDIELSNRCNLRCKVCWFYGENGVGDRYEGEELTTDEVFSVVDQLAQYNPLIYLGGSEPFTREDFLMILRHIKNRNIPVSFSTNGTLLDSEKMETLVALGVDNINISIDGNEELNDQIRGRGVFKKVTTTVKKLSAYREKVAGTKPSITINIVITRALMGRLKETLNAIRDATGDGADFYRLHHLWYVTKNELLKHQSIVAQKLSYTAPGAACHEIPSYCALNPKALADEIMSIRRMPKVIMFPNLSHTDVVKYYSERASIGKRCMAPFLGAVIKPNGDVKFCPDEWIDDYILGNVRTDSFQDIWNNKRARKFRAVILREKHFAGCKRCSWMYSYG